MGEGTRKICFHLSELLPKNQVSVHRELIERKNKKYTTINLRKNCLKPLRVLHGRVVALSKDEIIGATAGGGNLQSRYDKAIEMASDGGMLFDAVADDYSR